MIYKDIYPKLVISFGLGSMKESIGDFGDWPDPLLEQGPLEQGGHELWIVYLQHCIPSV